MRVTYAYILYVQINIYLIITIYANYLLIININYYNLT